MQTVSRTKTLAFAALAFLPMARAAPPTPDMVTSEPLLGPVSSKHQITVGGARLDYTATFAETPLKDDNGTLRASISSTSYIVDAAVDRPGRPVIFLFNGGPGASSSPLHFDAFGPRLLTDERDAGGARKLIDNQHTLLDLADLVFIDPPGTGFSRERPGADSGAFWGVREDAASVLQLIRQWLTDNHRIASPIFLVGESYGGFRLAVLLKQADDLPIAGAIFISPLLDASGSAEALGNDLPYILSLPSMAIAAWEHGKINRRGRTLERIYAQAEQFAQSDYAVALQKGSQLPAAQRTVLAQRLAGLIGLPATAIDAANLRIGTEQFRQTLLAANNQVVGRLDSRVTAPKPNPQQLPDRPAAANDPALGLGASNVIKSEPIKLYMQQDLGVQTTRDYLSLTLDVNFRWRWYEQQGPLPELYSNPTPNIATAMLKHPHMRVLLVGGYYDLAVPVLAPRYAITHAGIPLDRVTMISLAAPHSTFHGEDNLAAGSVVVRNFLRPTTASDTHGGQH